MNVQIYTKEDLKTMQAWPLQRKIQVTQAKIMEWYIRHSGQVYISFSGGKDSTVLLDLARRAFPDIPAAFVDTGLEYPEIREFVKGFDNVEWLHPEMSFKQVLDKYGYPVVSKEVAKRIYYARKGSDWAIKHLAGLTKSGEPSKFNQRYIKWQFLVDAPFIISEECCGAMKKKPLDRYQKLTSRMPIVGSMACESMRRKMAYLHVGCNGYDKKKPSSQPMAFWTEQDVLLYLKETKLPYSPIYGDIVTAKNKLVTTGAQRTGCMFCMFGVHRERFPNRFQRMEFEHPKRHDYCINKLGCGAVLDFLGVPYTNNV